MTSDSHHRVRLGFWIYLMTDCVLFATLFASFVVLRNNTFGGPNGLELFSLNFVLIETILLLISSFSSGLALVNLNRQNVKNTISWLVVTGILGATFLAMEIYEFQKLAAEGAGWQRSAFLSAFFTLVGTHGLHICIGLMWLITMIIRIYRHGLNSFVSHQTELFGIFWHFLDIIWIFIFTVVYLFGAVK